MNTWTVPDVIHLSWCGRTKFFPLSVLFAKMGHFAFRVLSCHDSTAVYIFHLNPVILFSVQVISDKDCGSWQFQLKSW